MSCRGTGLVGNKDQWSGGVVCLYLLGMTLMFVHVGSASPRNPPPFTLPRLLVMAAVALLVWRRGGLPSTPTNHPSNASFEAYIVITVCSLALAYLWHMIEVIIFITITTLLTVVESVTGVSLICDRCTTAAEMYYPIITLIGALTFIQVLAYVLNTPLISWLMPDCGKRVAGMGVGVGVGVRFWPRVRVVFVNPRSHSPEHPLEAPLSAPGGGRRNPVVKLS